MTPEAVRDKLEQMRWPRCASAALAAHISALGDLPIYPTWQSARCDRLRDWASQRDHLDPADRDVQIRFLNHELTGSGFSRLGGRLAIETDVEAAVLLFADYVSPGAHLDDLHERIMVAKSLMGN